MHLDVGPGEVLALVGPSGAGKTTLVGLLPRLWDVDAPARSASTATTCAASRQQAFARRSASCPRRPPCSAAPSRDNIRYGRLDATQDEIIAAARSANAHDFITALPDGYDTLVGDRGSRLSGGQRQRIAIARAILKDPPILLLDEATSSLDNESERLVQEALDRLKVGRTTIIVAHRLSTIRAATGSRSSTTAGWWSSAPTTSCWPRGASTRASTGCSSPRWPLALSDTLVAVASSGD